MQLVELTPRGLFCRLADIYIDPQRVVPNAIITHAHSDHAIRGHKLYIAHEHCVPILKGRLGLKINCKSIAYGEKININGVIISLHPAGHILGSAQVRIEYKGEVLVVSGDYKLEDDGLSAPFEIVKCHTFITESTFGLPIFQWDPQQLVFDEINSWWKNNRARGLTSVILGYSLGKAQRILLNHDPANGDVYTQEAVFKMNKIIREICPHLPQDKQLKKALKENSCDGDLLIVPPAAENIFLVNPEHKYGLATASGWKQLEHRRLSNPNIRGFVLSDHVDWPGLTSTIKATEAETVYITHGYSQELSRWFCEQGINAFELQNLFVEDETKEQIFTDQ